MNSDDQILPYAGLLRTIGQFVDDHHGSDVAIMELPDCFLVRYSLSGSGETVGIQLRAADLRAEESSRERARRLRFGLADDGGLSYRLRVIGQELERLGAHEILVESMAGEFVVSYQHSDPRQDYAVHKTMEALSDEEIRDIAAGAQWQRRTRRKRFAAG